MRKCLLVLVLVLPLLVSAQNSQITKDTTIIVTPERIGAYLSDLLIHRCDMKKSPMAVDVERLFPSKDYSEYEDSPAKFILKTFYNYQLLLPKYWDSLLFQADSLNIDDDTNYLTTYFNQAHRDQFWATAVLKKSTEYYALSFRTIEANGEIYIMELNDELKPYKTVAELKQDCFFRDRSSDMDEEENVEGIIADLLSREEYPYKQYKEAEVQNIIIPSEGVITESLRFLLKQEEVTNSRHIFLSTNELLKIIPLIPQETITDQEFIEIRSKLLAPSTDAMSIIEKKFDKEFEEKWNNLFSFIKEKGGDNLSVHYKVLNNVFLAETGLYNLYIIYEFESEDKTYRFTCYAILIDNQWKLLNISPVTELEDLQF